MQNFISVKIVAFKLIDCGIFLINAIRCQITSLLTFHMLVA
jgi:hypothetical protein